MMKSVQQCMTNAFIASVLLNSSYSSAATVTRVTVLELGNGGVVHQTGSHSAHDSADAVRSFWSSLHDNDSVHRVQHPSMSLVPDFFNRADGGLVLGLVGDESNDAMSKIESVLRIVSDDRVGDFTILGPAGVENLLHDNTEVVRTQKELRTQIQKRIAEVSTESDPETKSENKLEKVSYHGPVDGDLDDFLSSFLNKLKKEAEAHHKTVIVYLVYNTEDETVQRSRRLDNNAQAAEGEIYIEGSLFSGFSYMKDGKVIRTPTKTIYEIQTFNIYLWSSIALFVAVFSGVKMFANMSLFPDSLLFGEAGKPID